MRQPKRFESTVTMTLSLKRRAVADVSSKSALSSSIPLAQPEISGNEWAYIKECLDSGWVSSAGSFVHRFESDFAKYLGVEHAVATVNGTAALHVALLAAGVMPDDEVLMPSFTFIAPANAVRYAGAWPVFVDAEPRAWQMDVARAVEFLEGECRWSGGVLRNPRSGRRIGAILAVHVLGHPTDLDPLLAVAAKYDLPVIEDAAESLGATYRGRYAGRFGRLACFSFNGNKVMTTGGGGMVVTDDEALANRVRYLTTTAKDNADEGIHEQVGFNYRLTNIQAAMGCAQLELLGEFLAAKRRIADRYTKDLAGLPGLSPMPEEAWAKNAFWLYSIRLDPALAASDSRALRQRLRGAGIDSRFFWQPLHLSPAHAGAQFLGGTIAEQLHSEVLSIPCSTGLSESAQVRVIAAIRDGLDS